MKRTGEPPGALKARGVSRLFAERRHVLLTVPLHAMSETDTPRCDITCFRCGEVGHKKGECRTWKTKMCRHQACSNPENCAFAHSREELRTPWVARCVRVVRGEGDKLTKIGCGRDGHTYRDCPLHQGVAPAALDQRTSR